MKSLILCSFILSIIASGAVAQKGQPGCTSASTPAGNIVFFGIDYSLVRFSYVDDDPAYIVQTLPQINRLFITEARKYDVGRLMAKNVVKTDLEHVNSVTGKLSGKNIMVDADYAIREDDVRALISQYPGSAVDGVGLVFVAEQMNKRELTGSYYVTFFDLKTGEVLTTCRQTAKPKGFGFRNYWAATIYGLMKAWK